MVADNSVALVTGGGSGIGRETALEFASEGARVVVADVDVEGGEETVVDIEDRGGDALFVDTDVTDAAEADAMVEAAVEEYGCLDYAFNNAGIGGDSATVDGYDAEHWESVIDVNLVGVFK